MSMIRNIRIFLILLLLCPTYSWARDNQFSNINEFLLENEENVKTLLCNGNRTSELFINGDSTSKETNPYIEYLYLGDNGVYLRIDGTLAILALRLSSSDEWTTDDPNSKFSMSEDSINYSWKKDDKYYKDNPEESKIRDGIIRTGYFESFSVDRYSGNLTHKYTQLFRDSVATSLTSERVDTFNAVCKLAGKQQF